MYTKMHNCHYTTNFVEGSGLNSCPIPLVVEKARGVMTTCSMSRHIDHELTS